MDECLLPDDSLEEHAYQAKDVENIGYNAE